MASSGSSAESTGPHRRRELSRASRSRDTRPHTHLEEVDYDDDENNPVPSINPPPGTEIARGAPDPPQPSVIAPGTLLSRPSPHLAPLPPYLQHHVLTNFPFLDHSPLPLFHPLHLHISRSTLSTATCSSTSSPPSTLSPSCYRPTTSQSIFTTSASQTTTSLP